MTVLQDSVQEGDVGLIAALYGRGGRRHEEEPAPAASPEEDSEDEFSPEVSLGLMQAHKSLSFLDASAGNF